MLAWDAWREPVHCGGSVPFQEVGKARLLSALDGSLECHSPHWFGAPVPHVHLREQKFCPGCGDELEFDTESYSWSGADPSVILDNHVTHTTDDCTLSLLKDIRRLLVDWMGRP